MPFAEAAPHEMAIEQHPIDEIAKYEPPPDEAVFKSINESNFDR
jgi:hypothetical protein